MAKPLRAAQSGSEPETIGLAPEPEPYHQLSHWSRAMTTLDAAPYILHVQSSWAAPQGRFWMDDAMGCVVVHVLPLPNAFGRDSKDGKNFIGVSP